VNFSFFIAKRYFLTRKLRNVINIISLISVVGVAVGTMALVVVLSVFNGFDELIKSTYSTFDPDLKIQPVKGKVFTAQGNEKFQAIQELESVAVYTEVLEENALVKYDEKQYIGRIKGVEENFSQLTDIDSMVVHGSYALHQEGKDWAVIGQGVAYYLSVSLNFMEPLNIYVPERGQTAMFNPREAFNRKYIFPIGIFSIQQDYDMKYILVPIQFARDLLDYDKEVTGVELKIKDSYDQETVQQEIQSILGPDFEVKNRSEQHAMLNKVMKSEKFSIFLILTFILIVASFNIIGSLTMLIIDKKDDIIILRSLGANIKSIKRIFFLEGWMISIVGSLIGVLIGVFITWLQERFGLISLNSSGSFMIEDYPVHVQGLDVLLVFVTVVAIGFFASYYPVRYITRKFILSESREKLR
jgi:lipoprotein-releasing system permease protein